MSAMMTRLQDLQDTATRADRKIARILMLNYPQNSLGTVAEIAEQAGTSGPSVIRFVQKMGFDGFPDFQQAVKQELGDRFASPHSQLAETLANPDGPQAEIAERPAQAALTHFTNEITHTLGQLSDADLEKVAQLVISTRRRVLTLGGRHSHLLAEYLASHLHQLRPGVASLPRGEIERTEALVDIKRGDLLIVFDYRRYDPDILRFCHTARERKATIVLITDYYNSPILALAGYVLASSVQSISPFDSLVPALVIVETLIARATSLSGSTGASRIEQIDKARSKPGDPVT